LAGAQPWARRDPVRRVRRHPRSGKCPRPGWGRKALDTQYCSHA